MFKIGLDCFSKLIFSAGSVGTSKRYMYIPINLVDYLSDGTQELFQFIQTERYHSSFLGRCYIYPAEFSTEYNKDGLFRCHDLTHKTVSTVLLMNASFFLFGLQYRDGRSHGIKSVMFLKQNVVIMDADIKQRTLVEILIG